MLSADVSDNLCSLRTLALFLQAIKKKGMKKFYILTSLLLVSSILCAQFTGIEVEEVPNNGKVPGKTYRIYAKLENQGDIIDAVFAEEKNPIEIKTTGRFYQHPLGGALSNQVQRFDVQNDPILSFDSWFTIGSSDNYMNYVTPFMTDSAAVKAFESGEDFVTYTMAWFATADHKQTQADRRKRVLLMQITTDGKVTGRINLHGREKIILDEFGDVKEGGFIIEERNVTFTCG